MAQDLADAESHFEKEGKEHTNKMKEASTKTATGSSSILTHAMRLVLVRSRL